MSTFKDLIAFEPNEFWTKFIPLSAKCKTDISELTRDNLASNSVIVKAQLSVLQSFTTECAHFLVPYDVKRAQEVSFFKENKILSIILVHFLFYYF